MFKIILLAIIQGISEFLPISSSAHLIIFRKLLNISSLIGNELTFDVSLHLGTLLSILFFFYKDFIKMIHNHKILINIIVATIPAGIVGFIFEDIIDNIIRNNLIIISLALIIMGIIIYEVDIKSKSNKNMNDINIKDSIIIGISQIFALIPGFSRSGVTITGARLLGLNKEDSTKFSFYLSVPIILGATLVSLIHNDININIPIFIIGIGVSFITGIWCINFLLNYLKKNNFKIFMWYRIILGLLVLISLIFI